jgi:predicted lipid-binding transport protein (Tim44 family)
MDGAGAGTAIMLAIAAVLWFVYLVPTWVRKRRFIAREVLGEYADPKPQAKEKPVRVRPTVESSELRRRRLRRTRLAATGLLTAALAVTGVQVWLIATTGMSLGAFFVLVAAITAGGAAIATQRRVNAVSRPQAAAPARTRTAVQVRDVAPAPSRAASWTPVEMPRPMYLSRPAPETTVTSGDLQEALRVAAAKAEATLRAAQSAREVLPMRNSKYAGMGVLSPDSVEERDLDEVLRRRRSVG